LLSAGKPQGSAQASKTCWVLAFRIAAEIGEIARFAPDITRHEAYAFRGAGRSVGLGQRAALLVDGEPQSVAAA
jgi:hypothetical protein